MQALAIGAVRDQDRGACLLPIEPDGNQMAFRPGAGTQRDHRDKPSHAETAQLDHIQPEEPEATHDPRLDQLRRRRGIQDRAAEQVPETGAHRIR